MPGTLVDLKCLAPVRSAGYLQIPVRGQPAKSETCMSAKSRTPKPLSLLPLLVSFLILLPACTPSTPPPPTSTRPPTRTPIRPTLNPNRPKLAFSPTELPEAVVGQPYEVTIAVANNETPIFRIAVDDGELPPGLALTYEERAPTATIMGTPTDAGEFGFELVARCLGTYVNGQEGYQSYTLLVKQE